MRIPAKKELAIKKSIMKAIESGNSVSALANHFGISKSTIYKYRRAMRDLGFIKKNENDVYVITENKFSSRKAAPKTSKLDLSFRKDVEKEYIDVSKIQETLETQDISEVEPVKNLHQKQNKDLFIQNRVAKPVVAVKEKGLLKKIFGKLKKTTTV